MLMKDITPQKNWVEFHSRKESSYKKHKDQLLTKLNFI